jgi:N6-adenosine-specific RNA methylase IME4
VKYRTIVADPPWAYHEGWPVNRGQNAGTRIGLPYGAMTLEAIHALPVAGMAEDDAHLLMWTTNRYVREAYAVAESWGFRPSQLLTWCKQPVGVGPGGVFANTSEFCLYARRGKPEHLQRDGSTWWVWPRGEHSQKPEAFLDKVEATLPGPYLELFARRARFGWDYWGDQSLGTVEMVA